MPALAVMAGVVVVDGNTIPNLAAQLRSSCGIGKEEDSETGFELDFWDYATFITGALLGLSMITLFAWLAGLPWPESARRPKRST